jgi:transcriptional regulator with XRE-family HTH domain
MLMDRLTKLRTQQKKTKKEVAEYLQVHESTYGKYELGHREPDYKTLHKLADYFGVPVGSLLREKYTPSSWDNDFCENLSIIYENADPIDMADGYVDIGMIERVLDKEEPILLETACQIAEEFGESLDEMVGRVIKDTEKPALGAEDGLDFKIVSLVASLPAAVKDEALRYLQYLSDRSTKQADSTFPQPTAYQATEGTPTNQT